MTVFDFLLSLNAYPLPTDFVLSVCIARSIEKEAPLSTYIDSSALALAKADIYMWLADAPDISQGGQSNSIANEVKKGLRDKASALYDKFGIEAEQKKKAVFGYRGEVI